MVSSIPQEWCWQQTKADAKSKKQNLEILHNTKKHYEFRWRLLTLPNVMEAKKDF